MSALRGAAEQLTNQFDPLVSALTEGMMEEDIPQDRISRFREALLNLQEAIIANDGYIKHLQTLDALCKHEGEEAERLAYRKDNHIATLLDILTEERARNVK